MRYAIAKEFGRERWSHWVRPHPKKFNHQCCDCSLLHEMQFRFNEGDVEFRVRRKNTQKRRSAPTRSD